MTSIKVTYQSTIRRFTVPNTITWSDLESKLRLLFYLPPTLEFALSYKDEDGDTIILSTDLELQEVLSSQPPQSTLKFGLVPEKRPNATVAENDFVSVEEERFVPDVFSESDDHVTEVDVADEVESYLEPTTPSVSKGKQKESSAEPRTSAANHQREEHEEHQSPPPNDDERQRAPFIDLAEQFQRLLDQFQDVLSKNPQLIEQVNAIMDQILRNVPVDIDQLAQWLNTFRPEGDLGGETDRPRGEQQPRQQPPRQAHDFGPFGNLSSFIPPHVLSNPWIQRMFHDGSAGFGNFGNFSGTNGGCPYRPSYRPQSEGLSPEELKEKIKLLHQMGFWEDDIKNEELLRKYDGNIERVVKVLIEQKDGHQ